MKILSLGLDKSSLDKTSALAQRLMEYGDLAEKYAVIVPSREFRKSELSDKVAVYGSGGGGKLAQFIKIYNLAGKLLREEKYDVITVQDQYYLAAIALRLSKKFRLGLEIQVHGFEKHHGLRKLIVRYLLPRADAVRCVSQRLARQLIQDLGVARQKITVVPICSELRVMNNESERRKNGSRFIFLTVGRLVPVKNIGLQIEAMAEVVNKQPKAELWIVGDGPEKKNCELKIKNYKLSDKIKMFGWQSDLKKYYNQADAFLLTSNYEGWGLAVIEAAASGLPIIMTDVGCAGEAIVNGQSGLIIPAGDKLKLVEAMLRIGDDESLRKNFGENARLAVSRLPTKQQTLALYKKSWEIALANKI